MTTPQSERTRRRPKFRKGQVVGLHEGLTVPICFGKIRVVSTGSGGYYLYNVDGHAIHEKDIRELTKREARR